MALALRNTLSGYGLIGQFLHWSVAVLIALQYVWAWRIAGATSLMGRFELVNQHKSIGMTVLMLAVVRLIWRAFDSPPPLPGGMRRWEAVASSLTHGLLYLLLFALPISGWLYTAAAGFGAEWFGLIRFVNPVPVSDTLMALFGIVHRACAIGLPVVLGLHVAAALRHHFVLRDDVLRRMLPVVRAASASGSGREEGNRMRQATEGEG